MLIFSIILAVIYRIWAKQVQTKTGKIYPIFIYFGVGKLFFIKISFVVLLSIHIFEDSESLPVYGTLKDSKYSCIKPSSPPVP